MSTSMQGLREKRHKAVVPNQYILCIKVQSCLFYVSFTVTVYWSLLCYCTLTFSAPCPLSESSTMTFYVNTEIRMGK